MRATGPLPYAVLASVAFGLTALADLYPSFAGRVDVDHPVTTAFVPAAALDPWRMMFASGMSERADGGWLRFSCQVAHDARQATFLYEVERTDR